MANKKNAKKVQKHKAGQKYKYNILNNLHFHKQNTMKRDKNEKKNTWSTLQPLCIEQKNWEAHIFITAAVLYCSWRFCRT